MATDTAIVDLSTSQQPGIYTAVISTYAIALFAICLRITARKLQSFNIWLDDYLAIGGLLFATAMFVNAIFWLQHGLGKHYQTLDEGDLRITAIGLLADGLFYSFGLALVKFSMLAFYGRLFPVKSIKLPVRVLTLAIMGWLIGRFFGLIFNCVPTKKSWDPTVPGHCGVNSRQFFLGTVSAHLILDVILLSIPLFYINTLKMDTKRKLAVIGMFLLGGFICVVTIVQLYICAKLDEKSADATWNYAPVVKWATVELNVSVASACLPSLRPIFTFCFNPRKIDSSVKESNYYKSSSLSSHRSNSRDAEAQSFSRKISYPRPQTPWDTESEKSSEIAVFPDGFSTNKDKDEFVPGSSYGSKATAEATRRSSSLTSQPQAINWDCVLIEDEFSVQEQRR